jgi:hypothetical protein
MARQSPLTIAEREAIYYGKLGGRRLRDLAKELSCSLSCARKWWSIGRDQGLGYVTGTDRHVLSSNDSTLPGDNVRAIFETVARYR